MRNGSNIFYLQKYQSQKISFLRSLSMNLFKRIFIDIDKKLCRFVSYRKIIPYLWSTRNFFIRNRIINTDHYLGGGVYLYFFRIKNNDNSFTDNLGDYLSKIVVSHFIPKNQNYNNKFGKEITLYAIGSILGFRTQNAVVWGSGILEDNKLPLFELCLSKLDIRAVRGPKTYERLIKLGKKVPKVFGDPAILMPFIYLPPQKPKKYAISLILNHMNRDFEIPKSNINKIEILTSDYENFINQIVQSRKIISSSLHGIILAETYGIPAILLLHENQSMFKYKDYYYSTGRYDITVAHNVADALTMQPMQLPNLKSMQEALIKSFPNDIFIK